MNFHPSIRFRLIFLVLLAVVPALVLILFGAIEQRHLEERDLYADTRRFATFISAEDEQLLDTTRQLLSALAHTQEIGDGDLPACQRLLIHLVDHYPRYVNLAVAQEDGSVWCSARAVDPAVNLATVRYFQQALQNQTFAVGDYQAHGITQTPALTFGYPIVDVAGRAQGVLVAALDLRWLNRMERSLVAQINPGSNLTKVDEDGVILVRYPDPDRWVGQPLPEPGLVEAIRSGQTLVETTGVDGVSRLYALDPLSSTLGAGTIHIILGIPTGDLYGPVEGRLMVHLLALAIAATLALAAAWFGGERLFLRPVRALLQAIRRLGTGDLSGRSGLAHRSDEFGQLASAFDEMAETLESRTQQLQASEKRYRQLFERNLAGVSFSTLDGTLLDCNHAFARMFGYESPQELMSRTAWDIYYDPADRETFLSALREQGVLTNVELRLRNKKGDPVWILQNVSLEQRDGTPTIQGIVLDITERKQIEMKLERYAERLRIQHEIDRAILSAQLPDDIVQAALKYIRDLVECRRVSVALFDREAEEAAILAVQAADEAIVGPGDRVPLTPVFGDLDQLDRGEVHTVADVQTFVDRNPFFQALWAEGVQAYANVPLIAQNELIGSLNLGGDAQQCLDPALIEIAREVADSLAIAIRNAQLFESVQQQREELRALAARLAEAEEMERRRLARDLHDDVGQNLTALHFDLNTLRAQLPPDLPSTMYDLIDDAQGVVTVVAGRLRQMMAELRPDVLDDYGLVAALHWYGEQFEERTGISTYVLGDEPTPRLDATTEIALFRIAQEALTNVAKHARTEQVTMTVHVGDDVVRLGVSDEGVGFVPTAVSQSGQRRRGWGLINMRERAEASGGHLRIISAPGEGTQIIVEVPR